MLKLSQRLAVVALLFSILLAPIRTTTAADFKREVIYQIITDRFFDGSSSNNNPSQSSGLYDSTKTNWRAYWGGDLAVFNRRCRTWRAWESPQSGFRRLSITSTRIFLMAAIPRLRITVTRHATSNASKNTSATR